MNPTRAEDSPKTTVVVAVDFAGDSDPAVAAARDHARRTPGCAVHLVHVIPPGTAAMTPFAPVAMALGPNLLDQAFETGTKLIEALRRDAFADVADVATHVCVGTPGVEIVERARGLQADSVIVGTHGRTGVARALLGSVAEYVVRHAPCPVLVARPRGVHAPAADAAPRV